MCFLASFSVDLQVPNQCRRKMEIACSESSFFPCELLKLCCVSSQRLLNHCHFYYPHSAASLFPSFSSFLLIFSFMFLYDSVFLLLLLFLFLIDDVPPYFKMEPPQTQVHLEGNRLVLTCMAEGSWPLEFKWIYNGTELTRFSLEYR